MTIPEARELVEELRSLKRDNGLIYCEDVVKWARSNPDSKLYSRYEWDVDKAAWNYWMWQTREVIASVKMIVPETQDEIRVFWSISTDRVLGGGYRETVVAIKQETTRDIMLADVLTELQRIRDKYASISEFAKVWKAIDEIKIKPEAPKPSKKKRKPESGDEARV